MDEEIKRWTATLGLPARLRGLILPMLVLLGLGALPAQSHHAISSLGSITVPFRAAVIVIQRNPLEAFDMFHIHDDRAVAFEDVVTGLLGRLPLIGCSSQKPGQRLVRQNDLFFGF
ncbi:hypothetical protein ACX12L_02045 [Alicycliphilus sp. T452]